MKVLVIGRGAREHALGWKIRQSPSCGELFFAPGNAATAVLGKNLDLEPTQIVELADWAQDHKIELTVVGPENPLMLGIQEEFTKRGLLLFGPSSQGARLEGSKIWAKEFMMKHGIPTALARDFTSHKAAVQYVSRRAFPLVIKADGLAEGKGVAVCRQIEEAEAALRAFMLDKSLGAAGERILIEEHLEGSEISAFALCDGNRFCYLGEARDYKRAYDGDHGPNTGGMGAVSDSSLGSSQLRDFVCEKIFSPTLEGLVQENVVYQGVLFAGLILTREGPKLLEYNVRFGDPETQVLFPRVDEDLLPLLKECAEGRLTSSSVRLKNEAAVGVVVAAGGYPGKVQKGIPLPALDDWPDELLIFQASTVFQDGKIVNEGGRTLTIVARDPSLEQARKKVYQALETHSWGSYFYRKDIGNGLVPAADKKQ